MPRSSARPLAMCRENEHLWLACLKSKTAMQKLLISQFFGSVNDSQSM
jgi:hypothetical protein